MVMNLVKISHTLQSASDEIGRLRSENHILSAQVRVIDVFDRALQRSGGWATDGRDIRYELGECLTDIKTATAKDHPHV